jgi:hypothetical protein
MNGNCGSFYIPPEVSPQVGLATQITANGVAVMVIPPGAYGGYIWNPFTPEDQGILVTEPLFVNPISAPGLEAFGSTIALYQGADPFFVPAPRSTYGIWVNAATAGHRFTVVYWVGP